MKWDSKSRRFSTVSKPIKSRRKSLNAVRAFRFLPTVGATNSKPSTRFRITLICCGKAGVNVSINSDSAERIRRLNLDAAKVEKYGGVPEQDALQMITLNPAKQLGIDKRTGSIEIGKDADIVIWSAHPFSVYSRVEQTMIDGELFFERSRRSAQKTGICQRTRSVGKTRCQQSSRQRRHAAESAERTTPSRTRRSRRRNTDKMEEIDNGKCKISKLQMFENYNDYFISHFYCLPLTAYCLPFTRKMTARSKIIRAEPEHLRLPTRES